MKIFQKVLNRLLMVLAILATSSSLSANEYEVFFDGNKIPIKSQFVYGTFPAYRKNNEIMMSLRIIQEYMYRDITWDFIWKTFSICGLEFKLNVDEVHTRIPALDGNKIFFSKLPEPPILVGGRYYVPLLETMKLLGNSVIIDNKEKNIQIKRFGSPSTTAPGLSCK